MSFPDDVIIVLKNMNKLYIEIYERIMRDRDRLNDRIKTVSQFELIEILIKITRLKISFVKILLYRKECHHIVSHICTAGVVHPNLPPPTSWVIILRSHNEIIIYLRLKKFNKNLKLCLAK